MSNLRESWDKSKFQTKQKEDLDNIGKNLQFSSKSEKIQNYFKFIKLIVNNTYELMENEDNDFLICFQYIEKNMCCCERESEFFKNRRKYFRRIRGEYQKIQKIFK